MSETKRPRAVVEDVGNEDDLELLIGLNNQLGLARQLKINKSEPVDTSQSAIDLSGCSVRNMTLDSAATELYATRDDTTATDPEDHHEGDDESEDDTFFRLDNRTYQCKFCPEIYHYLLPIRKHIKVQHPAEWKSYKCVHCKRRFSSGPVRDRHVHFHSLNHPFRCTECDQMYRSKKRLEKHFEVFHNRNSHSFSMDRFHCGECELTFVEKKYYDLHSRIYHARKPQRLKNLSDKIQVCEKCVKIFDSRDLLMEHIRETHQGDPPLKNCICQTCSKDLKTVTLLRIHILVVHMGIMPFVCQYCNGDFSSRHWLLKHLEKEHSESALFKCPTCDESFTTEAGMIEHKDKFHAQLEIELDPQTRKQLYPCGKCEKKLESKDLLDKHQLKTHPSFMMMYKCPLCPQSVRYRKQHMRIHHDVEYDAKEHSYQVRYKCRCCSKLFQQKGNLLLHQNSLSNQCSRCQMRFKTKKNLQAHMAAHRYRSLKCEDCGLSFGYRGRLEEHWKRYHSATSTEVLKIINCPYCPKLFISPSNRGRHITANHVQSEFKVNCGHCPVQVTDKVQLRKHYKTVHPEERLTFKCPGCDKFYLHFTSFKIHYKKHKKEDGGGAKEGMNSTSEAVEGGEKENGQMHDQNTSGALESIVIKEETVVQIGNTAGLEESAATGIEDNSLNAGEPSVEEMKIEIKQEKLDNEEAATSKDQTEGQKSMVAEEILAVQEQKTDLVEVKEEFQEKTVQSVAVEQPGPSVEQQTAAEAKYILLTAVELKQEKNSEHVDPSTTEKMDQEGMENEERIVQHGDEANNEKEGETVEAPPVEIHLQECLAERLNVYDKPEVLPEDAANEFGKSHLAEEEREQKLESSTLVDSPYTFVKTPNEASEVSESSAVSERSTKAKIAGYRRRISTWNILKRKKKLVVLLEPVDIDKLMEQSRGSSSSSSPSLDRVAMKGSGGSSSESQPAEDALRAKRLRRTPTSDTVAGDSLMDPYNQLDLAGQLNMKSEPVGTSQSAIDLSGSRVLNMTVGSAATDLYSTRDDATATEPEDDHESEDDTFFRLGSRTYQCKLCPEIFRHLLQIRKHIKVQHPAEWKSFKCVHCKRRFPSGPMRDRHVHFHSLNHPFRCTECDQMYRSKKRLEKHFEVFHNRNSHSFSMDPFHCGECELTFVEKKYYDLHSRIYHERKPQRLKKLSNKIQVCEKCVKIFDSRDLLMEHIRETHQGDPPLKNCICQMCSKDLKTVTLLKSHILVVHMGIMPFVCQHCNAGFSLRHWFLKHLEKEHSESALFKCPTCDESFTTEAEMIEHKEKFHAQLEIELDPQTRKQLYPCGNCEKKLESKDLLDKHQLKAHPSFMMMYKCPLCPQSVRYRKQHMRIHHDVEYDAKEHSYQVRYQCRCCSKLFQQKGNFLLHQNSLSNQCSRCQMRFNTKKNLQAHMAAHRNRSLKCEDCGLSFSYRGRLEEHWKRYHSATSTEVLKIINCPYCPKLFISPSNRVRHIAANHVQSEFKVNCGHCPVQVTDTTQLRKHYKTVHPEERLTFKCPGCDKFYLRLFNFKEHYKKHKKEDEAGAKEGMNSISEAVEGGEKENDQMHDQNTSGALESIVIKEETVVQIGNTAGPEESAATGIKDNALNAGELSLEEMKIEIKQEKLDNEEGTGAEG